MATDPSRLKAIVTDVDAPIVGVAVTITPQRNTHVGIVYRAVDDQVMLLQLNFHVDCESTPFDPSWLCAAPNILDEDAEIIAGHCRSIVRDQQLPLVFTKIRYALHYNPRAKVGVKNKTVLALGEGKGLNCVTFVLAIFKEAGPALIKGEDWPERQSDVKWHKHLVKLLKKRAPPKYWKRVAKDIGCARIRPEELVGACLEASLPANHSQCIPNGQYVLNRISVHTGRISKW